MARRARAASGVPEGPPGPGKVREHHCETLCEPPVSSPRGSHVARVIPHLLFPLHPYIRLAAAIKEVVDLPALHAGRIVDSLAAERVLAEGGVDMAGMTR